MGFISPILISSAHCTDITSVSTQFCRLKLQTTEKNGAAAKRHGGSFVEMNSHEKPNKVSRRQLLRKLILTTVATSMTLTQTAQAFTAGDAHAKFSEIVSKLPGAGMPDIYFPEYFLGTWDVSRRLLSVKATEEFGSVARPDHLMLSQKGLNALQQAIGMDVALRTRFFSHRGHIIQDRAYDAFEEISTLLTGGNSVKSGEAGSLPAFNTNTVEASWDPDNANVLSLSWGDFGESRRVREVKVTKRAFKDQPQGVGTFVASEYARVVDVEGEGALLGVGKPPSNYARRRVSRFTVASVTDDLSPVRIYRLVVDYIFAPNVFNEKTVITLKFKDTLSRIS